MKMDSVFLCMIIKMHDWELIDVYEK